MNPGKCLSQGLPRGSLSSEGLRFRYITTLHYLLYVKREERELIFFNIKIRILEREFKFYISTRIKLKTNSFHLIFVLLCFLVCITNNFMFKQNTAAIVINETFLTKKIFSKRKVCHRK